MELGERVLEGQGVGGGHTHWNPGIGPGTPVQVSVRQQQQGVQQQPEVWPMQPSECLMNVVNTTMSSTAGADVSSMFGGYPLPMPLILSADGSHSSHRLAEFNRHRFPLAHSHSAMHFSNIESPSSVIGISHHDGLTLNNIPSHPMIDGQDSEGNSSVQVQGQDRTSMGMEMEGRHGLDDCSEECSDDDEDEEDSDDEEMRIQGSGYVHHNQSMNHPALNVEQENPLPSCQQQHTRQLRVINSNGEVGLMGSNMDDTSCHQKNNMMSHVHEIEGDIPPISQGHPLNSNPISAIPMITGNLNSMMIQQEVVGGNDNNSSQADDTLSMNMGINGDPSNCNSNGHSVHGKMYVEERVVFHLKQWTDSGFGNFNSCREQDQHKNQYRCAVCHIRSPHNNIPQKDTHRHLVRGILFSFEDCIILELYPEDYPDAEQEHRSDHPLSMDPKQIIHMGSSKADEAVPLSYFSSSSTSIPNIVLTGHEPHSLVKPPGIVHDHNNQGWWDYESERDVVVERHDNINHHVSSESCAINLKLTAQHFHETRETDMEAINEVQIEIQHENDPENDQDKEFQNYQEIQSKYSSTPSQYYSTATAERNSNENDEISIMPSHCVNNDNVLSSTITEMAPVSVASLSEEPSEHLEGEDSCPESERVPSLPDCSDHDIPNHEDTGVRIKLRPTTKKNQANSSNKYPCPCCNKYFSLKRLLKDHLEEKHSDGNPLQCSLCKMQYTDGNRLQKHSCTLSVESIKHRLKIKEAKDLDKSEDSAASVSNQGPSGITGFSIEAVDNLSPPEGESDILELVMSSKSSKIRKFSEKASLKSKLVDVGKQLGPGSANDAIISIAESELPSVDQKTKKARVICCEDEENATENRETHPKSCKFNSTPIKVNQDQNMHLQLQPSTEVKAMKSKEFRCDICGKCFSQYRRLINHAACHKPEKRSQCDKCGKSFARRDKLMRHMYVHSEEKMFSCDICDKRFSRRDKLSDHLKSHQTDEIHNCNICDRQFLRPDILKQHVKMHQMDDKHQCRECLRFVTGKERLDQHMKRHEEAKALGQTLLCPLCTKYFIQTQSLKAHMRKFHGHFGSSDEKEFVQNMINGDNIRSTESPSSSNSNSSMEAKSPMASLHIIPKVPSTPVLENVMSSSKPKTKLKPPLVKTSISTEQGKLYSCIQCPKTFSRKQTLKNHELQKHAGQKITTVSNSDSSKSKLHKKSTKPKTASFDDQKQLPKAAVELQEPVIKPSVGQKNSNQHQQKQLKEKSSISTKKRKKISHTKPSTSQALSVTETNNTPCMQNIVQQTLTLPSCASLTHDLGFNLNINPRTSTFQHSQTHLSAYSQQLALSMVTAGRSGINMQNMLQNPCNLPLDSVGNQQLHHQQLSSLQLINSHGVSIGQASICPQTSSFVINYPTSTTMSFQDQ